MGLLEGHSHYPRQLDWPARVGGMIELDLITAAAISLIGTVTALLLAGPYDA